MSKVVLLVKRVAVGAVGTLASVAAFAQTTGTGVTPTIVDTPIVASINGVVPVLIDVGGAVLAVVAVAWAYKTVKGFMGR